LTRGWIGYNMFNGQPCLPFPVPGARTEPEPNQDTFHLHMNKILKEDWCVFIDISLGLDILKFKSKFN